jgi:hypothetical protein
MASLFVFCGAAARDRTGMKLPSTDFKSVASANSATAAYDPVRLHIIETLFFVKKNVLK